MGEGIVFGSVCLSVSLSACLSVCLSVREHNSKSIGPISFKFVHKVGCPRGSVLLEDDPDRNPDPDSTIF